MAADATQYLLPDGIGLDTAVEQLAARFDLAVGPGGSFAREFYDTFDGRLHAAGLALIAEDGRLLAATGPSYAELAAAAAGALVAGDRLFAGELPDGRLRDLLEPIVEVRALRPIARIRGRRVRLGVLNGDEKTVVRLVLEGGVGLRGRAHIAGVRGYDRALKRVRRALAEDLGWSVSARRLDDEAVLAAGGSPGGSRTQLDLRLAPDGSASAGGAIALREMLRTIEALLPGTVEDVDTEFLHDLRVAVRRTRSVQRQLAAVFPAERLRWFRDEFRWLGQVTGPTRDLDVLVADFHRLRLGLPAPRAAELELLGRALAARREAARTRMVRALGSERTRVLVADWAAFVEAVGEDPGEVRLSELVGRRIRAVYRQMRRAGAAIEAGSPAERLHDLRKQGKELRYLLEIFAGLYPAEAVRLTVKSLKGLQETLGQFQDREVQATTLRAVAVELAADDGGPAALIALGVVLDRVDGESRAARGDFAARFAVFAAADQRAIVQEAFR